MKMDLPPGPPPSPKTAAPAPPPAPATVTTTPDDRGTAFKPVESGNEMQSGEKLLVEAYAAIWIILFAMVLLSWRRQKQLEARVDGLEGALDKARRAGEGDKGGA
jgi:CcmD family protein